MKKLFSIIAVSVFLAGINLQSFSQSGSGEVSKTVKTAEGARKRALLVGFTYDNKYPKANKLDVKSDLRRMTETLVNRFGYSLDDIRIIADLAFFEVRLNGSPVVICDERVFREKIKEGCRQNIIFPQNKTIEKEFNDFLIQQTDEGDFALFYFSGHGQTINPLPKDKSESDECDESLVTYSVTGKSELENLRDNEIDGWLKKLAERKPANVTVIFDSCYSGGATRGNSLISRMIKPSRNLKCSNAGKLSESRKDLPGNFFILAASQSNQLAYEYCDSTKPECQKAIAESKRLGNIEEENKKVASKAEVSGGVFTYHLVEALEKSSPQTTYQGLIDNIRDKIYLFQMPLVFYNQNQRLFAGTVQPRQNFFVVNPAENQTAILEAGKFHGMTKGSKLEIYRAGTIKRETGKWIATATIVEVSERRSILKIETDNGFSALNNASAVAFESEHNFDSVLKITIADEDKNEIARLKGGEDLLKPGNNKLVESVDEKSGDWNIKIRPPFSCKDEKNAAKDEICRKEKNFRGVVLQRRDGSVIERIADDSNFSDNIKKALQRESYYVTFKSLLEGNPNDSSVGVKIRLYDVGKGSRDESVENGENITGWSCSKFEKLKPSEIKKGREFSDRSPVELTPGRCIAIEIENTGEKDVYITVFDWTPQSGIKGFFPQYQQYELMFEKNGSLLKKGAASFIYLKETKEVLISAVGDELGDERIGIIATVKKPENNYFSAMIDSLSVGSVRGVNREALSPFQKLIFDAQNGTRSPLIIQEEDRWGAAYLRFTIVSESK